MCSLSMLLTLGFSLFLRDLSSSGNSGNIGGRSGQITVYLGKQLIYYTQFEPIGGP